MREKRPQLNEKALLKVKSLETKQDG